LNHIEAKSSENCLFCVGSAIAEKEVMAVCHIAFPLTREKGVISIIKIESI